MNDSSPQGPTIPSSTNFLTNFTRLLKITESIEGNSFSSLNPATPGTNTKLSHGTLSDLNDPVLDSQGATYAYAQAHGGSGNPGGPLTSVQYNNSGVFGGSNSLTFNKNTNTLTANMISNGSVTIGSSTISGLSNPISGQQAATKAYVDSFTSLKISNDNTIGSTTYNANNLINSILYRNTGTSGTTTDFLPTAAQITAAANAIVGTSIYFGIKNVNADYTNVVTFMPGTGITIGNLQNIFSGYEYNGIMIVTNITPGFEAVTIYTLNCNITNTINWGVEIGATANVVNTLRIKDFQLIFNNPSSISTFIPVIFPSNVSNKVSFINPTVPIDVDITVPDDFMGVLPSGLIEGAFIWTSGGTDFYVINQSTTPGANVTIKGAIGGTILWTLDPNSNMKIPPGYTGWFMVYLTVSNFPKLSSLTQANVYCLGIFPNT